MSYACVTLYEPVATGHDLPETHRETMKRKEKQMGIQDVEDFEQNTLTEGDKLATRDVKGLPLLVYVVKRLEGLNTKHGNNKPGLICDILDLTTGTPYTHVLWMNNQVIDNLSKYEGKAVPIRIEEKHSNKTGNDYLLPVALEGQERQTANDWAKARPDIFDTDRAAKGYPTVSEVQGGLGASVSVGTGIRHLPLLPLLLLPRHPRRLRHRPRLLRLRLLPRHLLPPRLLLLLRLLLPLWPLLPRR